MHKPNAQRYVKLAVCTRLLSLPQWQNGRGYMLDTHLTCVSEGSRNVCFVNFGSATVWPGVCACTWPSGLAVWPDLALPRAPGPEATDSVTWRGMRLVLWCCRGVARLNTASTAASAVSNRKRLPRHRGNEHSQGIKKVGNDPFRDLITLINANFLVSAVGR